MPVLDLILGEQEVEEPYQEEQEGAWASEAYLDACCQGGMVVVQVGDHQRLSVGLEHPHLEAWPLKGASMEASIQEEEQGGNREVACLAWAFQIPVQLGLVLEQMVVAERLQTADVVCLPGTEGSVQPGVALQPSRAALLWNPS